MASPQVENGFTRIANELLEALTRADLSGSQFRIVLTVIRESYGRGQKAVVLSYSDIERLTGVHRNAVSRELGRLEATGYIIRTSTGANRPNSLSVQKDYTRWATSGPAYSETAVSETAVSKTETYSGSAVTAVSGSAVTPHTPLNGERNLKKHSREGDESLKHPAVSAYRETLHITPNAEQRKIITETVTDLERWKAKLDRWKVNGYSPKNLAGLLDSYSKPDPAISGYHRANGKTGPPLPPAPTETLAEINEQGRATIAAMIANGDLPEDWQYEPRT